MTTDTTSPRRPETVDRVVIRFAGDSGDGMQLVGDRFTELSAAFGNDLATLPDFPAEIRAPAGTIAGVSSFQVHISDHDILTPGDVPNVLVAMNPAALRANVARRAAGRRRCSINSDAFEERNLEKAGYAVNPLDDGSLAAYRVIQVPMTSITLESTAELGVKPRDAERSKNFFALGLVSWMYTRPTEAVVEWIEKRFADKAMVRDANLAAFKAGYHFGETAEIFGHAYEVPPADLPAGRYRNIIGNLAVSYGLIAASQQARPADRLRVVPDHARVRRAPRAVEAQELRRPHDPGRGRDQRRRRRDRRRVRRPPRCHGHQRARHRPQGRGHGPRGEPRAAVDHRRRTARRAVHRPADEDRAVRPAPGDVRPARRGAAADRRGPLAQPLLRRRVRGGAASRSSTARPSSS